jgi:hypothetical protein
MSMNAPLTASAGPLDLRRPVGGEGRRGAGTTTSSRRGGSSRRAARADSRRSDPSLLLHDVDRLVERAGGYLGIRIKNQHVLTGSAANRHIVGRGESLIRLQREELDLCKLVPNHRVGSVPRVVVDDENARSTFGWIQPERLEARTEQFPAPESNDDDV